MIETLLGQVLALVAVTLFAMLLRRWSGLELPLACVASGFAAGQMVGWVNFDTGIRAHIPPRSSNRHLRVLYEEMLHTQPGGETDLSKVFHDIVPRLQKRGMIFILSDCFTDVKELLKSLAHFRHASHEVVIFHVMDRDEVEFPFDAWTRFENLELAGEFRMVDPTSFRAAYLDNFAKFTAALKEGCQRHRIDLVPMYTHESLTDCLARFLRQRQGVV